MRPWHYLVAALIILCLAISPAAAACPNRSASSLRPFCAGCSIFRATRRLALRQ